MSDNNTAETNNSRSFEERVFARFDAMDQRFDSVDKRLESLDGRVEKLEMKQYDTKPIWEQALQAISQVDSRVDQLTTKVDQLNDSLHEVGWKIDALNHNFLKIQADQRYNEKRMRDIESRSDPT